jgi:hypothetical protein
VSEEGDEHSGVPTLCGMGVVRAPVSEVMALCSDADKRALWDTFYDQGRIVQPSESGHVRESAHLLQRESVHVFSFFATRDWPVGKDRVPVVSSLLLRASGFLVLEWPSLEGLKLRVCVSSGLHTHACLFTRTDSIYVGNLVSRCNVCVYRWSVYSRACRFVSLRVPMCVCCWSVVIFGTGESGVLQDQESVDSVGT